MNNSAFTFQTPHPDAIIDVPFEHGIRVDSGLAPFNSCENRVCQFQDKDRRRLVVKLYRPERWIADQILKEYQLVLRLVDGGVPVAASVAFNGRTLLNHQRLCFAVFSSAGGHRFEADNIDQMEAAGCYLGCTHQTGRKQLSIHRPTIGLDEYLIEPRKLFEDATLIPSRLKAVFLKATDELIAAVTARWREDFTVLRLHEDCHVGNIPRRDGPMLVNLDDVRNGSAVQGLWMLLNSDKAKQRMRLETIIKAYEEFSKFDIAEIGLTEPLRAIRLIYYLV